MMEVQPEQLRALSAIIDHGGFEAAANSLDITQSAVSQRLLAMERQFGRPMLRRGKPPKLTDAGQLMLRFARHTELLTADLVTELDAEPGYELPAVSIVVNADSLATWVLPALAPLAAQLRLELLREDQDHSLEVLRQGDAIAAITSESKAAPGCSSTLLGIVRYLPICSPEFAARWFEGGANVAALAKAPTVIYDRKDDLQDRYLRLRSATPPEPPRHYVPASSDFMQAIELGFGWGMVPRMQAAALLESGALQRIAPRGHVDVPLYWQQWRLGSVSLKLVADAIKGAAKSLR
ncbi:transcriptional regulator, LysR family [Renibacterium salmoninarum ATCC 33209]|uniref:Transcriptional regulator, LysR family n=1 Tax=Renibacterium salmoninarum (strain ATCC 33209 / DSM 20767 / JCM 11484 / NBRC 15589 / NCIMB 2235) TaxID=288705 RepID=A9WTX7_RENSM|nr:LysR family transcriptional regulator ArgP [Renibacterium salmoninarum]ABY24648.1 transcriptional regulator, LysR family [Renibacterium salmoninarum ATCC 33209]